MPERTSQISPVRPLTITTTDSQPVNRPLSSTTNFIAQSIEMTNQVNNEHHIVVERNTDEED